MQEVFDFVECADPEHKILWNIESKINPQYPNRTLGVEDFVKRQHALFSASPYASQITVRCTRLATYGEFVTSLLSSTRVSIGGHS